MLENVVMSITVSRQRHQAGPPHTWMTTTPARHVLSVAAVVKSTFGENAVHFRRSSDIEL